jgi:hypothetical protein
MSRSFGRGGGGIYAIPTSEATSLDASKIHSVTHQTLAQMAAMLTGAARESNALRRDLHAVTQVLVSGALSYSCIRPYVTSVGGLKQRERATRCAAICMPSRRYSISLLYWYKRTNTDAKGAPEAKDDVTEKLSDSRRQV